jgi:hypothetical protein
MAAEGCALAALARLPNLPGLKNNYFASGGFAFNRNTIDTKVNWNVNDKMNVFGRFSLLHYTDFTPTAFGTVMQGSPIGGRNHYMRLGITFGYKPLGVYMDGSSPHWRSAPLQRTVNCCVETELCQSRRLVTIGLVRNPG